jgi:hypothetical protein
MSMIMAFHAEPLDKRTASESFVHFGLILKVGVLGFIDLSLMPTSPEMMLIPR